MHAGDEGFVEGGDSVARQDQNAYVALMLAGVERIENRLAYLRSILELVRILESISIGCGGVYPSGGIT